MTDRKPAICAWMKKNTKPDFNKARWQDMQAKAPEEQHHYLLI
jgi:hypothetical protein